MLFVTRGEMSWKSLFTAVLFARAAVAAPSSNFKALQQCVSGALAAGGNVAKRVQSPANATWDDAYIGAIIKPETPAMITFAESFTEVGALMGCANSTGYQAVPRSGRHHFEGWSALNGSLVIDVSSLSYVKVSSDLSNATIGAGTNLGQIYTELSVVNKTFLGGICPTVALGGYLGVGGYSLQHRALGIAVDQVLSFKALLASGELVTVSPTSYPDLWFAARGGGQYAFIVEATVKILTLPRSAMVVGFYNNSDTRYEVARKWLDWAPTAPKELTTQLNVYNNRTHLIGWYLGGTPEQLRGALNKSGLLEVPDGIVSIDGNCSTANSRMYWQDPSTRCTDDASAYQAFLKVYNTEAINLTPIQPVFRLDNAPAIPSQPVAEPWPRFGVISKTYFTQRSKPIANDTLREVIDSSAKLGPDAGFWGEWTSFGIANPTTTSAFPWLKEAQALMRIEMNSPKNVTEYNQNRAWLLNFEKFFRPKVGNASYAGYVDADISINPLTAFYGNNTCRLISIKQKYDPNNFFRNPFSVPTKAPKGITC
ncbi:uncharacterized protein PV07_12337 [Cladophialophora immunda]|uniref:FAD-binding PCMH-type domain-containing protein n=1 Tax=Cladophialophora immunda TaxID=569365 RepID=A0A0D2BTU9_9EURO|nr:uncharacterized protein PV07_12337 [Cladophialophora immunda]KIW22453.1 hypothetical protein PV07_12337 [Cladophialophora immunda]OQU98239.1 FAD binding domain-containing protein [Cladophialophora immunda]